VEAFFSSVPFPSHKIVIGVIPILVLATGDVAAAGKALHVLEDGLRGVQAVRPKLFTDSVQNIAVFSVIQATNDKT
jgi:hypothetical protein